MSNELNEGEVFPCCSDLNNRMTMEVEGHEDLIISMCMVCNRRHFELTVDSGEYNIFGTSIEGG